MSQGSAQKTVPYWDRDCPETVPTSPKDRKNVKKPFFRFDPLGFVEFCPKTWCELSQAPNGPG